MPSSKKKKQRRDTCSQTRLSSLPAKGVIQYSLPLRGWALFKLRAVRWIQSVPVSKNTCQLSRSLFNTAFSYSAKILSSSAHRDGYSLCLCWSAHVTLPRACKLSSSFVAGATGLIAANNIETLTSVGERSASFCQLCRKIVLALPQRQRLTHSLSHTPVRRRFAAKLRKTSAHPDKFTCS